MPIEYGASHRKMVQDVNSGVISKAPTAKGPTRGVSSGAANVYKEGRKRETYDSGENQNLVANALLKAAGDAVEYYGRKRDRAATDKAILLAGTEEGDKIIGQQQPIMDKLLWGPKVNMRLLEETTAKTRTVDFFNDVSAFMNEEGHRMDPEEFHKVVQARADELRDKYDDEDFRDTLTVGLAPKLARLARDHKVAHERYKQTTAQQTAEDKMWSAIMEADTAALKAEPQDLADAAVILREGLKPIDGMSKEAHALMVGDAVTKRLNDGDMSLYRAAMAEGYLDNMTGEQRYAITRAYDKAQLTQDADYNRVMATARAAAAAGNVALLEQTLEVLDQNPGNPVSQAARNSLFQQAHGVQDKNDKESARKVLVEQAISAEQPVAPGTTAKDTDAAVASVLRKDADSNIHYARQAAALARGETYDTSTPISERERLEWHLENPAMWEHIYKRGFKPPRIIGNLIHMVTSDAYNPEMPSGDPQTVVDGMKQLEAIRRADPSKFAQVLKSIGGDRYFDTKAMLRRYPGNPAAALYNLQQMKDRERTGGKPAYDLMDKESKAAYIDNAVDDWDGGLSDEGEADLRGRFAMDMEYYINASGGDVEAAVQRHIQALQVHSVTYEGRVLPEAKLLEHGDVRVVDVLDGYFGNSNAMDFLADEYEFPTDIDITDPAMVNIRIDPDAGPHGAVILIPSYSRQEHLSPRAAYIPIPGSADKILETDAARASADSRAAVSTHITGRGVRPAHLK